jgi:hypothetical protein
MWSNVKYDFEYFKKIIQEAFIEYLDSQDAIEEYSKLVYNNDWRK